MFTLLGHIKNSLAHQRNLSLLERIIINDLARDMSDIIYQKCVAESASPLSDYIKSPPDDKLNLCYQQFLAHFSSALVDIEKKPNSKTWLSLIPFIKEHAHQLIKTFDELYDLLLTCPSIATEIIKSHPQTYVPMLLDTSTNNFFLARVACYTFAYIRFSELIDKERDESGSPSMDLQIKKPKNKKLFQECVESSYVIEHLFVSDLNFSNQTRRYISERERITQGKLDEPFKSLLTYFTNLLEPPRVSHEQKINSPESIGSKPHQQNATSEVKSDANYEASAKKATEANTINRTGAKEKSTAPKLATKNKQSSTDKPKVSSASATKEKAPPIELDEDDRESVEKYLRPRVTF